MITSFLHHGVTHFIIDKGPVTIEPAMTAKERDIVRRNNQHGHRVMRATGAIAFGRDLYPTCRKKLRRESARASRRQPIELS